MVTISVCNGSQGDKMTKTVQMKRVSDLYEIGRLRFKKNSSIHKSCLISISELLQSKLFFFRNY